jgi:hypothetical protein
MALPSDGCVVCKRKEKTVYITEQTPVTSRLGIIDHTESKL